MMKLKYTIQLFCLFLFMSCQSTVTAQAGNTDKRMQFFPANDIYFAGVNVYSQSTGNFAQYYVNDGKWTKNETIKSPSLSMNGRGLRMIYRQGDRTVSPSLFVYSTVTGEFEFKYLDGGEWKENTLLPKSRIYLNSRDIRMDYTPGKNGKTAFLSAYSTAGNEIKVLEVINGQWVEIPFFPTKI